MGRTVSSNLQTLLNWDTVWTQTTLDLYFNDGHTEKKYATDQFTGTNGRIYDSSLRKTNDIKQTISAATDRVNVVIQNVDKVIGGVITTEDMTKCVGVIGRQYDTPGNTYASWVELFRGQVRPVSIDENEVVLEILNDLTAAGYCVGEWSLAPDCQFVYKHAATCGFSGGAATCNKKRRSLAGCAGKIVTGTTTNEYRFGGMEFPDPVIPSVPGGGDIDPPIWLPCFTADTPVWTPENGDVPISTINLGDRVMCYDRRGVLYDRSVTAVHSHWVESFLRFTLAGGRQLQVTEEHLVLTQSNTFRRADTFRPGQMLTTWIKEQKLEQIESIELVRGSVEVWSIEVAGLKTHFANRIAVHNSKEPPDLPL